MGPSIKTNTRSTAMIGVSSPLSKTAQTGWLKFHIAEALGIGEHKIWAVFPGPPVLVVVNGPDYDEQDRPSAVIEAYHPNLDGISWDDIWEAVRRQYPTSSPY